VHAASDAADASRFANPRVFLGSLLERSRSSHPELDVKGAIVPGPVVPALAALSHPGDLLVIGTHQHAFPHRSVTRCLSWEIASASTSSVVVVPQVDLHLRSGAVVGIDHHASGARLARIAAREGALLGGELTIVQAVTEDVGSRRTGLAIEDAVRAAREESPSTVISSMVTHDDIAHALLHAAHHRALLVLGESTTRGGNSGEFPILRSVLAGIPVPVYFARGICDPAGTVRPVAASEPALVPA
jgi:hypothetical protein